MLTWKVEKGGWGGARMVMLAHGLHVFIATCIYNNRSFGFLFRNLGNYGIVLGLDNRFLIVLINC